MGWLFGKKKKEETGRTVAVTEAQKREIMGLLANGRKIEAIRILMKYTGMPVAEAKSVVENDFSQIQVTESGRQTGKVHSLADLPDNQKQEIANMLNDGRKVQAIKLLQDYTGLGLAEAKAVIDKEG